MQKGDSDTTFGWVKPLPPKLSRMENYYHAHDNSGTEFIIITHAILEGKCMGNVCMIIVSPIHFTPCMGKTIITQQLLSRRQLLARA